MTVVFGLASWERDYMCTCVQNNGQEQGSAVNSVIDQGEFEATKTLSGHGAPHCCKHHFHAEMTE